MTDKPRNPPAFPDSVGLDGSIYEGMTLRDHFAGLALNESTREVWAEHKPEAVARRCYIMADAMLAARGEQS